MLEYPGGYTRSVGPVIGRFLTGLRDGRIEGVRLADGRVLVPPTEYDPTTSDAIDADGDHWIEVGPAGHRAGVHLGRRAAAGQAPARQAVRVRADPAGRCRHRDAARGRLRQRRTRSRSGLRVAPRWKAERVGHITDIEAWVPLGDGEEPRAGAAATSPTPKTNSRSPASSSEIRLEYELNAGRVDGASYLRGLGEGKIIGGRRRRVDDVYAASRGTDPKTGEPTSIEVEVQDTGVITTFCVVNMPGLSELAPEIPYVSAQILLDGANNTFFGLIRGAEVDDVHMGMRVKAKWADELKPDHTLDRVVRADRRTRRRLRALQGLPVMRT